MTAAHEPSDVAVDAIAGADPASLPSASGSSTHRSHAASGDAVAKAVSVSVLSWRTSPLGDRKSPPPFRLALQGATWSTNPMYKRLAQAYLAACRGSTKSSTTWSSMCPGTGRASSVRHGNSHQRDGTDQHGHRQPSRDQEDFETGGASSSLARNWVHDLRKNGGMPSVAKPGALKVGEDLALTTGAVIDKDDRAEVLSTPRRPRRCGLDHARRAADRALLLPRSRPGAASSSTRSAAACRPSSSAGATRAPTRRNGTSTPTPRASWRLSIPFGKPREAMTSTSSGSAPAESSTPRCSTTWRQGVMTGCTPRRTRSPCSTSDRPPPSGPSPCPAAVARSMELQSSRRDQRPSDGQRLHLDAAQ